MKRGTFQFEVAAGGDLVNSARNVEVLRRLGPNLTRQKEGTMSFEKNFLDE